MVVDVFRTKTYVIILVRDEDEKVVGVMPLKILDMLKYENKVVSDISDFMINLQVLPPVRIVFHRNDRKLRDFISKIFKEAEKKIEEKIERIKRMSQQFSR